MGHERLGFVPKTKRWQALIGDLAGFSSNKTDVSHLASNTLENVRSRFACLPNDEGVNAAFSYLVWLSYAGRTNDPSQFLKGLGIGVDLEASPFQISKDINRWVSERTSSNEYAEIAKASAMDAVYSWSSKVKVGQDDLFGKAESGTDVWRKASQGSGFCELSRLFFAKFTEKYIAYFLEREASAKISNPVHRDRLHHELQLHINELSKHAFESAKITQSFSAGWYTKHTQESLPSKKELKGFLRRSFEKLREELRRQGSE